MTDSLQEKRSPIKAIIIILIAFLLIPIMAILIRYFTNEDFKHQANNVLTILPGTLGEYFTNQPTKEEVETIKIQIAKHYIGLDEDRLIDKLLIIKNEDKDLYDDLMILLSRENPMKMSNIKERIRISELQSSSLNRIMEEIDEELTAKSDELAEYLSRLKLREAVNEIERIYEEGQVSGKELSRIFENFPTELSSNLLRYINSDIYETVLYNIKTTKKHEIEKKTQEMQHKERSLKELADIYEIEPFENKISDLGTTDIYNYDELAIIYRNMKLTSAAQVLASVDDEEFIADLYENLNQLESLDLGGVEITRNLEEAVQVYRNYDQKVGELAEIYERIPLPELIDIIERMVKDNKNYNSYKIGDYTIVFSEEELVLDILGRFKPNRAAQVLELLRTHMSVDLSGKYVARKQ